jgi:hypothetical protein
MPDNPPRKHRVDAFASFENVPGASGRRRKVTWPLNPLRDPNAGEATDAARRFVSEAEVCAGLGRKAEK